LEELAVGVVHDVLCFLFELLFKKAFLIHLLGCCSDLSLFSMAARRLSRSSILVVKVIVSLSKSSWMPVMVIGVLSDMVA